MRRLTIAIVILLTGIQSTVYGQDDRLVVKPDLEDSSRFLCDIKFATFKTPKDFRPNESDKHSHAILTRADEQFPNVTQMISIDIGKPAFSNSKALAEAFATKWNGNVIESPITLDGETAFRVKAKPNNKKLQPVDCVVVVKDERAYLLIGGAKDDKKLDKAMDELVASWKWKK